MAGDVTYSLIRPLVLCCPLQRARVYQPNDDGVGYVEELVDPKMALMGQPIVGIDRVVYDESTGDGAAPAKPLASPKVTSTSQRAIHDLTHLPDHPGSEICVSCRKQSTQHRSLKNSERTVPLMVGDYCFPEHTDDSDPMTGLVIRVNLYKHVLCVPYHVKEGIHTW